MDTKQKIYLGLSILGLFIPIVFVSQFFGELGELDFQAFFASAMINPAASSMTTDLFIIVITSAVWIISEGRSQNIPYWWVYLLLLLYVSAAFALPLFMLIRERHLQK